MAKNNKLNVVGVRPGSVAMFEGTLAAVVGLGVAVLYSLANTLEVAASTNSVLTGMAFGLATGAVSIIVLPFVYFGLGWVVGYLHGWIFNAVLSSSGGVELKVED